MNTAYEQFYKEVAKIKLLTADEELALGLRASKGDDEAIKALVNANLRLVISIAKKYVVTGIDIMDLIQEGCCGLAVAAKKYDVTRGYNFSTYATYWIRQHVSDYLLQSRDLIKLPLARAKEVLAYNKLLAKAEANEEVLTDEQICEKLKCNANALERIRESILAVSSLNVEADDEGKCEIRDIIEDTVTEAPGEGLIKAETNAKMFEILGSFLSKLSDLERQVIENTWGVYNHGILTVDQIGEKLGIKSCRVRALKDSAMKKLKMYAAAYTKTNAGIGALLFN